MLKYVCVKNLTNLQAIEFLNIGLGSIRSTFIYLKHIGRDILIVAIFKTLSHLYMILYTDSKCFLIYPFFLQYLHF
jgi:hypothetical protein